MRRAVDPQSPAVAFVMPLYYQYRPLPDYPLRWGNWAAITLFSLAVLAKLFVATTRRDMLENPDRVFETETPVGPAGLDVLPPPRTPPA